MLIAFKVKASTAPYAKRCTVAQVCIIGPAAARKLPRLVKGRQVGHGKAVGSRHNEGRCLGPHTHMHLQGA